MKINDNIRKSQIDKRNETDKIRFADLIILLSFVFQIIVNLVQVVGEPTREVNNLLFFNEYILLFAILFYFVSLGVNRHFLIFSFFVCFFIFLMGQKPFRYEYGYDLFHTFVRLTLTPSQYLIFTNLIYFSLLTVFIGYRCVYDSCKKKKIRDIEVAEKSKPANKEFFKQYRNILRILFLFCFVCAFISALETISIKSTVSYEESYMINIDHSFLIKLGSYMFPGVFFMYLTARPKFIEMCCVSLAYLLVKGVLELFTGGRMAFASVMLFFIWYVICYLRFDKKKMPNIYLVNLFAFGVIIMLLFWFVQANRSGSKASFNLIEAIENFLASTGGSDSVIANTIDKADKFPKSGITYFFAPLKEDLGHIFKEIIGIFTGESVPNYAQGMEYLQNSDSFAHWISYIVSPSMYLSGNGMGSSYIAETYLAFGFVGVLLCGLILGLVLAKLSIINVHSNAVFKNALFMFLLSNVFTLPRSGFFGATFSFVCFIATMFIVRFCLFVMGQKVKNMPSKYCKLTDIVIK